MTNHGDDCYFFYYSNCTKGDTCPFRHCEAAMGSEIVCNLWQEGRCFRTVCKFRHMEITKNRKEICCYWENQPAGCQKPHCAFFHERPRCIDGTFVPPDKSVNKTEEQPHEEPATPPAASLCTASNPQLRGVKTETQEPVPSPTHPPVVINPADDDEDEDDQFSEEGDDGKVGSSPRKPPKSADDSLSFGVSTLEEIRLRKALKASMKRAGYPMQSPVTQANGEKENIQSLFGPALYQAGDGPFVFEETARPRGNLGERLGREMPNTDVKFGVVVPLKRGLSRRLGRNMDEEEPFLPPQKALKPIKDRLGMAVSVAPTQPADTEREPKKSPEQIRIKTLEEIRQEKAARSPPQGQKGSPSAAAPESNRSKTTTGVKRAITIRDNSINHTKTFLEGLYAKKKRHEGQGPKPKRSQGETNTPQDTNVGLRVKTLEEIRREKATKIQARQTLKCENKKSCDPEEWPAKKPHLLHVKLNPSSNATTEKSAKGTEKPRKTPAAAPETNADPSNNVKVKTFEEIMLEKHLRKQEMEDQARDCAEAEPVQKHSDEETFRQKCPTKVRLTSPGSSTPSSTIVPPDVTRSMQKLPVGKHISVRPQAASSRSSTTRGARGAAVQAAPSVPGKQTSPPPQAESDSQSPGHSREVPDKNRSSTALSPAKQDREAPVGPAAEGRTSKKTLNCNLKTSPEHTAEAKVRPKLNVKPSIVKPAVQVKPGQKRREAERSTVAAVKPLSSTSTVLQEPACKGKPEFPPAIAQAQLTAAVPQSLSTLMDSGSSCSPLREDLQTVPVFKQSQSQDTKQNAIVTATASKACTVPESPVPKTATQAKSRRLSVAAPRTASTSAMDDFEELINQFTEDHLEGDVDPGIEEDDLLQELSEMIDS
ncbi:zinc finger CCCH domain-containing protein 11A isoform 3-T6 [Spinachia spinachia]